jgi:hypothetical protein
MLPASQYVGSIIATEGFFSLLSFEDNVHEPRPTILWGNTIWFTFFTKFCETAFRINLYNVKSCYISLFIIIAHAQENETTLTSYFSSVFAYKLMQHMEKVKWISAYPNFARQSSLL